VATGTSEARDAAEVPVFAAEDRPIPTKDPSLSLLYARDEASSLTEDRRIRRQPGPRTEDELMTDHPATAGHPPQYLPAMGRRWLLPLYDPFTRLMGVGRAHADLLARADVRPGARVLEIGCGTGNLLLRVKRRCPDAEVTGLDPDPAALRRVRRKAARAGVAVRLDRGFAGDLPYPDESVDRVLSAFMLHHLDPAETPRALREVRRVLRPGGSLHVLDIVGGHHAHGPLGRLARRSRRVADSSPDRLLALLGEAGLREVAETGRGSSRLGHYAFYRAER